VGLVATQVKKDNALCEGAVQKTRSRNIQSTPVAVKSIAQARPIVQEVTGTLDVTVYLFGSWARGEAASYSDIDIAVDSPHPLPRGFLSQLRERFEESTIPYRVEVVDLRRTDPAFRQRVIREGIRWNG
jgi:predicted nucleotidyltransferase